jgi:hypothetical protein
MVNVESTFRYLHKWHKCKFQPTIPSSRTISNKAIIILKFQLSVWLSDWIKKHSSNVFLMEESLISGKYYNTQYEFVHDSFVSTLKKIGYRKGCGGKKKYHCQYISILFFPHTLSPFWQLQIWLFHQNRVPYSYFITFWQSSKYPLPPRCMVLTENFLYITQYLPPSIWSFIVLHLCCAINSWHLFSFYFQTKKN